MIKSVKILLLVIGITIITVGVGYCRMKQPGYLVEQLNSVNQVKLLFPITPDELTNKTAAYMKEARALLDELIAIPIAERTFENTAQKLDFIGCLSNLA